MKKYKIIQDRDKCLGCARCAIICPENWEMDESDFKAKCKNDCILETEYLRNKEAMEECPAQCIQIEECNCECQNNC